MKIIIHTDGASRGNPGQASYGFVIRDENGKLIYKEGKRLGIQTNNFAEYSGVLRAFEYVVDHIPTVGLVVDLVTDSQLLAEQLSGNYKVKNEVLKFFYRKIKNLELGLGYVSYRNVPRAENKEADAMANKALDTTPTS